MSKHERSESQDGALRHPSTKRAKEIDEHTPLDHLEDAIGESKEVAVRNVLHWFRSKDLRMQDNHSLDLASKKAKEGEGSLLTMYLFSPEDMEWHGTSPARSDFIIESLSLLKDELKNKNIPLAFVTAKARSEKSTSLLEFVKNNDVSHVFGNIEYEVDEIRRDIKVAKLIKDEKDVAFEVVHDQTIVKPLHLVTGGGKPHKVFTPYHKDWVAEISENPDLLNLYSEPEPNDKQVYQKFKALFETPLPSLPENKQFASKDERDRIRKAWPAGHNAGIKRLKEFLKDKVATYAQTRSEPAKDSSSRMSAYFSSGTVSVREAVKAAAKSNNDSTSFTESNDPGIAAWVREIVFREFYRHVLAMTPHTSMNLPQNLKFDFVEWEEDEEGWQKWKEGKTGVPFVDAGMRQLNTEAWMHNRARMNTASYLRTNLLIDYRKGERYFAEHLVDWDLSNNTQGWEPSYTVFNPVTQAERLDKQGEYIRRWVPELKDVKGKAIFAPHARLSKEEFGKLGYPEPHVDFNETKQRAVDRYKQAIREADL